MKTLRIAALLMLLAIPASAQLKVSELWVGATANATQFKIFTKQQRTTKGIAIEEASGSDRIHLYHDATNALLDINGSFRLLVAGTEVFEVSTTGQLFERNRTLAIGEFSTPTFNAGDFTAAGSMTWTLTSGDVGTYAYSLIGNQMTVLFELNTTTVGGTANTNLKIKIPASKTATKTTRNGMKYTNNNAAPYSNGFCAVIATSTTIDCYIDAATNWTLTTDLTNVLGQITFEVNP